MLGNPEPLQEEIKNIMIYTVKEEVWIIDIVYIEQLIIIFNQENKVEKVEIKSQDFGEIIL